MLEINMEMYEKEFKWNSPGRIPIQIKLNNFQVLYSNTILVLQETQIKNQVVLSIAIMKIMY